METETVFRLNMYGGAFGGGHETGGGWYQCEGQQKINNCIVDGVDTR